MVVPNVLEAFGHHRYSPDRSPEALGSSDSFRCEAAIGFSTSNFRYGSKTVDQLRSSALQWVSFFSMSTHPEAAWNNRRVTCSILR